MASSRTSSIFDTSQRTATALPPWSVMASTVQLGGGLVDVAADDASAAAREFDGERRPDAAASTGDHCVRAMGAFGR